jgi:multiple sugar transport system permease protein
MRHEVFPSVGGAARHEATAAWRLCAPTLALMLLLLVLPSLAVVGLSLTDAELGSSDWNFLGLAAYRDLLGDRDFQRAFRNTAVYVGLVAPASVLLGLALALLIESGTTARAFFRSVFFLPVVSLIVAMGTVWQYLMHPTIGPLNLLLGKLALPAVNWLGTSDTVLWGLAIIGIWQAVGFNMVLYLAGLTSIDRTLYQAAEIDGARSPWQRFRLVTWPMLSPMTLFVITISVINSVKVFETVAALTQGGPARASEVLLWSIYQEGFVYLHIGTASAMAVVFVAVLLVLILAQTRVLERRVQYQ